MSDLPSMAIRALEAFDAASSWEQRVRLLMQWGDALPALDPSQRDDDHLVPGCESRVWLAAEWEDGHCTVRVASDARLIRGLVALLLARIEGLPGEALTQIDLAAWFSRLGLARQLSPSRSNGLTAVSTRVQELLSAGPPA